jgi:hypothetical protein
VQGASGIRVRPVIQGVLFVLHTGMAWEHLPEELGFGSA